MRRGDSAQKMHLTCAISPQTCNKRALLGSISSLRLAMETGMHSRVNEYESYENDDKQNKATCVDSAMNYIQEL
jgi:hypothetical protein